MIELFLTLGLNMPTYGAAYHDAAIDGLARLARSTAPRPRGQENPNVRTPDTPTYQDPDPGPPRPEWSAWFEPLTVTRHDDGTTRIVGPMVDAAALYGLLTRLRDLGATLLQVLALQDHEVRGRRHRGGSGPTY